VFFSTQGYTTIGDKYIDPDRIQRQYELEKKRFIKSELVFKPATKMQDNINSAYPHEIDEDHKKGPKIHRDKDGKVIIAPKNITTGPIVEGLSEYPPHEIDPYDRARELAAKEHQENKKKMKEKAFSSTVHG
jgi:hypothetical protein